MVRSDVSAAQPGPDCLENTLARFVLAEMEFGNRLPSQTNAVAALERDVEAAFPVDEACDVVIIHGHWPFLLIVCTGRIFTGH